MVFDGIMDGLYIGGYNSDSQLSPDVCFLAAPCLSSPRALLLLASSLVAAGSCCLLPRRAVLLRSSSSPENVMEKTIKYRDYWNGKCWKENFTRRCSSPNSPPPPLPPKFASLSNSPRRVSPVVVFADENVKKNTIDWNGKCWKE
ncbi:hypothetical protein ACOSQ4_020452 [Xanthoceras sorbifolium]